MRNLAVTAGLTVALAIGVALIPSAPALANATACPHTPNTNNGTTPPNCNEIITFNANGSIATTIPTGATGTYDGADDALIGVFNNTNHAITSFAISGTNIFGFDLDGIDTFTGVGPVAGNPDTTGYGGPDAFFTITNFNSGVVHFANGGITAGGQDYFSLEEPASLNLVVTAAPEPGTLAVLGLGLLGLGVVTSRRRSV